MTFARVLSESGLGPTELAQLYGVSRQLIYLWRDGKAPKAGSILARQAEVITIALVNAIDAKALPLAHMSVEGRKARLARMTMTLQNLKPAPLK